MAKQINISNPFGDTPDITDVNSVDEALYGKVEIGKQGKQDRIRNLSINAITPDPMQPRRVVPSVVRRQSDGTPHNIITTWLSMITDERHERFNQAIKQGHFTEHDRPDDMFPWHVYLFNGQTERGWDDKEVQDDDALPQPIRESIADFGHLEASFIKVVNLASSIHRDGLSNPITVARIENNQYIIETGERRWLAYHLLDMFFEDKDYSKVPARLVEEVSIWRQASENNARDNLNAISRARQLAILLIDLYGYENFQPLDSFEQEQDFYAQVSDGSNFPVPRGKGEQIVSAMGLKNVVQIRQYRSILRLTSEQWEYADDTDMTEYQIRDWDKSDTVTTVTPQKQKVDKFSKAIEKLDRELSEKNWNKLSSEQRKMRYATLESLLHRLNVWGVD
jgi:hypothetical protein